MNYIRMVMELSDFIPKENDEEESPVKISALGHLNSLVLPKANISHKEKHVISPSLSSFDSDDIISKAIADNQPKQLTETEKLRQKLKE